MTTAINQTASFQKMTSLFHRNGMSMPLSKILTYFLLNSKQHVSMQDVIKDLGISKSSASIDISRLEQLQILERIIVTGVRGHFYRLANNTWSSLLQKKQAEIQLLLEISESAEEDFASQPASIKQLRQYLKFMQKELPLLIEKWRQFQNSLSE